MGRPRSQERPSYANTMVIGEPSPGEDPTASRSLWTQSTPSGARCTFSTLPSGTETIVKSNFMVENCVFLRVTSQATDVPSGDQSGALREHDIPRSLRSTH